MWPLVAVLLCAAPPDAGTPPVLPELKRLARALTPQVKTPWVKKWLGNVKTLKHVEPTTFSCSADKQSCAIEAMPGWLPRVVDDEFLYSRITDPLAYLRVYEVLAKHGVTLEKKKVLDFGYGNLGQLIMLEPIAAEVHGVEIDALLPVAGQGTRVTLHQGYFGKNEELMTALDKVGFEVWLSKNTLKRGYVNPDEGPRQIDLGADALLRINRQIVSGGWFFIYNIAGPRPATYVPMTDGRCPWSKEQLMAAGFDVIAHDADDSKAMRAMAKALEWGPEAETFTATYTLARKRVAQ